MATETRMMRKKTRRPTSVAMMRLATLSSRMLLRLSLRRLQEQGDVVHLASTLQAPVLLATRVRVRLGGNDDDL
jgi:hypothetical protein